MNFSCSLKPLDRTLALYLRRFVSEFICFNHAENELRRLAIVFVQLSSDLAENRSVGISVGGPNNSCAFTGVMSSHGESTPSFSWVTPELAVLCTISGVPCLCSCSSSRCRFRCWKMNRRAIPPKISIVPIAMAAPIAMLAVVSNDAA